MSVTPSLERHYAPRDFRDRIAYALVTFMRFFADAFFGQRYDHRAVVLETVAAVPGMVGGTLQHLRALRRMKSDHGWIRILLDEAENERMHLMTADDRALVERPSLRPSPDGQLPNRSSGTAGGNGRDGPVSLLAGGELCNGAGISCGWGPDGSLLVNL